jgi:sarcosine oxidase delta subunit
MQQPEADRNRIYARNLASGILNRRWETRDGCRLFPFLAVRSCNDVSMTLRRVNVGL